MTSHQILRQVSESACGPVAESNAVNVASDHDLAAQALTALKKSLNTFEDAMEGTLDKLSTLYFDVYHDFVLLKASVTKSD